MGWHGAGRLCSHVLIFMTFDAYLSPTTPCPSLTDDSTARRGPVDLRVAETDVALGSGPSTDRVATGSHGLLA